jgi:hypothetical protein
LIAQLRHNNELTNPKILKGWIWSEVNSIKTHPRSEDGKQSIEALRLAREGNPNLFDKMLDDTGYTKSVIDAVHKSLGTTPSDKINPSTIPEIRLAKD